VQPVPAKIIHNEPTNRLQGPESCAIICGFAVKSGAILPNDVGQCKSSIQKVCQASNYGPKTDHFQPCWLEGFKLGLNSK
jgi:hypothetical protein